MESNQEDEYIDNINIYNNKFYDFGRNYAIQIYEGVNNVKIYENEISASIRINDAKEVVQIEKNSLSNGEIIANLSELNTFNGNKLEKIIINENTLENYNINLEEVNTIQIEKNNIKNGNITIKSSNASIFDNIIEIDNEIEYVYKYEIDEGNDVYYTIKLNENTVNGNYKELELIDKSKYLTIIRDEE